MIEHIVFETEVSLWGMLADGSKTWDARRWDLSDNRIYRLTWGQRDPSLTKRELGSSPNPMGGKGWVPDEKYVSFLNKADRRLLTFEYLGMEFVPWASGWCFLLLGKVPVELPLQKGKLFEGTWCNCRAPCSAILRDGQTYEYTCVSCGNKTIVRWET